MKTLDMDLRKIIADETFNCRLNSHDEVNELAVDMEVNGQLNPVIVMPHEGEDRYFLVAGFRRVLAARKLSWPTIRAQVWSGDGQNAFFLNIGENVSRKNLSSYEIAARCDRIMKETGLPEPEIARRIPGLAQSYVRNLLRYFKQLHPQLLEAWKAKHPLMTSDVLNSLAVLDMDAQLEHRIFKIGDRNCSWLDIQTHEEESSPDEEEEERPKVKTKKMATHLQVRVLAEITKDIKPSEKFSLETKGAVLTALRFVLGEIDSVPWYGKPIQRKWGQVKGADILRRMRSEVGGQGT